MKCEYVDQLLPLYMGRDLEEERSTLVAAHLQTCTRCARAADEYSEVNRLLQEFEPPPFSQAVYAGIRRQVLNEVARTSQTPAWSSIFSRFLGPLVQPRAMWITAALLLAMLLGASYFLIQRSDQAPDGEQIADGGRSVEQVPSSPNAGITTKDSGNNKTESSSSSLPKSSNHRGSAPVGAGARRAVNTGKGSSYRSRQRETPIVAVAEPKKASPGVSHASSVPAPLRVEMQTSDPHIRIIWLSGQQSQNGLKDPSRGT